MGRSGRGRLVAVAVVGAFAVGLVFAPVAFASTTTITFDTATAGSELASQYVGEGLTFSEPNNGRPPVPICGGSIKSDPSNAHSSPNVAYSFCPDDYPNENLYNPNGGWEGFQGALATTSTTVSVDAGAPGGAIQEYCCVDTYAPGNLSVTLQGYNASDNPISGVKDTATVGQRADTLLSVSDPSGNIAYFTISGPSNTSDGAPLEIDDLSFEVPASPPPPQIGAFNPGPIQGYEGGTVSVPVTVDRVDGADDAITLHVSGLPSGVTLTGGQTVPAGSTSTTLTFAVATNAPVSRTQYSLTATTADASSPPAQTGTFSVTPGLGINLSQSSLTISSCSTASVTVGTEQYAPGTRSLTVSGQGVTNGLTASLGPLQSNGSSTLTITGNGTGGAGTATYTVTVHDGNVPTQSATLTVDRIGLTAQGIYVTQGTQTDNGSLGLVPSGSSESGQNYVGVTLVANKTTVARIYADASTSPAVSALLYGYENGKPLPGSPLQPDYGPLNSSGQPESTLPNANAGPSELVSDSELESNANAYTFTLPDSWTDATSGLQLVGQVRPTGSQSRGGCQAGDGFTLNGVPFQAVGGNFDAGVFTVAMTVNGVAPPPAAEVFADASAMTPLPGGLTYELYPYEAFLDITNIADDKQGSCGDNPSLTGTFSDDPLSSAEETAGLACSDIKDSDALSALTSYVQNYGNGTYFNGPHVIGVNMGVARGLTNGVPGQYSVVDGTAGYRPITSVGHELFHQYGLYHASPACGGSAGGDTNWPAPNTGLLNGIGLNTTSEPYVFIANDSPDFLSPPWNLPVHQLAYDLMSYCAHAGSGDPNTWISPENWNQLISIFGVDSAADVASAHSAGSRAHERGPLAALAQVDPSKLSVIGFVTEAGVQIASVGPQVGAALPHGTLVDSFTLDARGSHGQLLASVPMAATTGGHVDESTPRPITEISGEVPTQGVESVQLLDQGKVMATRARPAKAPRVKLLAPRRGARVGQKGSVLVRWQATNPEHLPLTAIVDYSLNGGRTWRLIFDGPNTGRASLPSFFFTASRDARVRVRISDGFDQTDAVSAKFTALGAPPEVMILTKLATRLRYSGDARLQLSGQAVDQLAQILKGPSLRWFDGPFLLGTGAEIGAGPLPPGTNHIRLVARDPSGRTGSASISVRVSTVSLPFLKLKLPRKLGRKLKDLSFTASSSSPATLAIGRHSFVLGMKSKRYELPIKRGRSSLLLELSVTANGIATPFAAEVTR